MKIKSPPAFSRLLVLAGLVASIGSASAAVVTQASNNDNFLEAQILTSFFSVGFVPEIMDSINSDASHVTVQGTGIGAYAWYLFTHDEGEIIVDIDNSTVPGAPVTTDLSFGLFNAGGTFLGSSDNQLILDIGSTNLHDPFLTVVSGSPQNFYVAVAGPGATFSTGPNGFNVSGNSVPQGSAYNLHILVPEPSSALLGALGAGLLLRRRRA